MKVLLYSRAFAPAVGGVERFAEDLAEWLAAQGHNITVVTETPDRASDAGRDYTVLRAPSAATFMRTARKSDVVHVNGAALRGIVPSSAVGRRAVVTHQGHQIVCPSGLCWPTRGLCDAGPKAGPCGGCPVRGPAASTRVHCHRAGASLAARNVCISRYLQRRLRPPRSAMIYNAVATRAFSDDEYVEGHEGKLAFAGRLVAEKGLDVLIRALPTLPGWTSLDVVGDGPMADPWRLLAHELGLNDRVRFLGAMTFDGLAEVYRSASVVVVPTVCEEAFGYAAAEAMALRRPVVATPSGALTELCAGGRGFVAADMSPAGLAASVATALASQDERRAAADAGHRFAKEAFAIDVVGRAYERLYEEVAG